MRSMCSAMLPNARGAKAMLRKWCKTSKVCSIDLACGGSLLVPMAVYPCGGI